MKICDAVQVLQQFRRQRVLDIEHADPFAVEGVAVKHGNEVHQAAHVTAAVHDEEQVGGGVGADHGAVIGELEEDLADLFHGDVLEEDQVQHGAVIFGNVVGVSSVGVYP